MSSGVGGSRVSIPNNVRKTIHDIREITGKQHSDDEIFAVLKECAMDPNETAQKLLYLDTFHEVKRRRDRRKESLNNKASEERSTSGVQRRGARGGGQGNYGSNFSSDAGGGKNAGRREIGANHTADRGSLPFSQRTKNNATPRVTKASTALPNGTTNLSNGTSSHGWTSSHGYGPKSSVGSEGPSLSDINKLGPASAQPAALGVTSSPTFGSMDTEQQKSDQHLLNHMSGVHSLDSLSTPSGSASTVENEAERQQVAAEPNPNNENKTDVFTDNVSSVQSESDEAVNEGVNTNSSSKPKASETSQPPPLTTCEVVTPEPAVVAAEVSSTSELHVSDGQHVTFPNHFQVPEALKNGLTFGSFDANFGPKVESVSSFADDNMGASSEASGDASKESSPSDQNVSSIVQGDYLDDNSQPLPQVLEKLQPSEDSKIEQSKQDTQFPPEGPQNPSVIDGTAYGLGIMPPVVGSHLVQLKGHGAQAHESRVPNFANGNSLAPPSTNASPPLPNSIAVSPQTVPVFRQTYPPNFFPYGHYLSPFYMPPTPMHQFLSHNGFPPQPSTGNVYLPPAPTGVKFSVPQFKPGNNAGNPTHIGIQSAGSFITSPVGYTQPVTSGSSVGNEDLVASHLKENQIYTTGQVTEGSAVWIHAAGQDMPSLQVNSLYNLPPQGHIAYSPQQSGHGTFTGMFPPGHAMTTPSTLLQQSQAMAGAIETIGPPSGAYQQPQHAQVNWNTAF
ncbi:hypothetical protein L484_014864 [Morus notabilis]|uniref:GBF-interacting protein 1 N-terminal domain-containing protein n=1 Tax=Morus notabilis TaxID=981085 RepID=W9S203_9ROSA|nr:GBF-interacting protein 1 [Morus notabilis]EXC21509.1 hypothetical protein L484_014864 [Morus notabilis]